MASASLVAARPCGHLHWTAIVAQDLRSPILGLHILPSWGISRFPIYYILLSFLYFSSLFPAFFYLNFNYLHPVFGWLRTRFFPSARVY